MMLSKRVFRKVCGIQPAATCTLIVLAVVLVMAGTVVAAGNPKTVAELALYKGPDRQQILEEGAKTEGKLTFYTSGILKQAVRPVVKAFEKKYPYIKVEIWRGGTRQTLPRLGEEYRGGKKICDVVEGSQTTSIFLQNSNIAQPFYSSNIANMEEEALTEAPGGGYYAAAFRGSGMSLGYNTTMISKKELPKTYEDLLDPKWKGKMAISATTTVGNWVGVMLHAYGEDFVKKIAQQDFHVHAVSASTICDMVIAGEYALSPTIFDSHAINSKHRGAPVDWIPIEPVLTNIGQIMLPKNAPHPHAALLFVDFELSIKSAEIHKAAGYSPFRKDVPVLKAYKKTFGPKKLEDTRRNWELFNRLFMK
ncbi:ABC transporter substrate-binding protein [Thermodesulfobacteriota bacterium]